MTGEPVCVPAPALSVADLYAVLALRAAVFVVEQSCPYLDPDGRDLDPATRHCWIPEDGRPVAYLRLLEEPGATRIGRVVTAPGGRGRGLAGRLLRHVLEHVAPDRPLVMDAQAHLAGWYRHFGFLPDGPPFVEDGIPHVPLRRPAP